MRLTNSSNLPEPYFDVCQRLLSGHPEPQEGVYSVTELLRPIRQIVLQRRYSSTIEQDVQDCVALIEGTAWHKAMESALDGSGRFITETRLSETEPTWRNGLTVTGQFDLYDPETGTIYDWKTTKLATVDKNRKGEEDDWYLQLMMYAELIAHECGTRPSHGVIVAMAKDHSRIRAMKSDDYPQYPLQTVEYDLDRDAEERERVHIHFFEKAERAYMAERDESLVLPPCTMDERWQTEDWAVVKNGATRAYRVFSNAFEAEAFRLDMPDPSQYTVRHRVSEAVNCKLYCPVRGICEEASNMPDGFEETVEEGGYVPF